MLSRDELDQYDSEGYVVAPELFEADDLSRVDAAIGEVVDAAMGSGEWDRVLELEPESTAERPVTRRIYHPFERHAVFRNLGSCARLLDRVAALIGHDLALQHSKLNMKPGRVGSVVHWHQDLAYFPHTNDDLCTVLIYLDEATEENGCLEVIPGAHRRYLDHSRPDGTFAGMMTEQAEGTAVALPAPAGSVIFMHALLPHSSRRNCSTESRRTLIFEYRAADAFPIWYGERTGQDESHVVHLRGEPAHSARFGGPEPRMPHFATDGRSLYQIQAETAALASEG